MHQHSMAGVAAGILLALAGTAQADTKTSSFTVSASVAANCFVSATNLNFGSYTGVAKLDSSSTVDVRCTKGSAYTLALSPGAGAYGQRLLSKGSDKLEYNLYSDQNLTSVWGDGTEGSSTVGGTGNGLGEAQKVTHTVYGELSNSLANQTAPAGAYTDGITVTVAY